MTDLQILLGDCREQMQSLADGSVQTCVTSPPYFGLRDYGVDGQLGLEPSPTDFVAAMVEVFREVRRVLADDGTLWLNLGDSYGAAKQLLGIPWRVAFALQEDGWYLRQDIIWHKPNPMPESVRDRCAKAHEYIFLFSKKPNYFFDYEAIKEPAVNTRLPGRKIKETHHYGSNNGGNAGLTGIMAKYHAEGLPTHRNRRSVWTVTTKPFKGAHFATFPPDLIEPCVLAGTSERGHCPECGKRWSRVVERAKPPAVEGSDLDRYGDGKAGVHRKVGQAYQNWLAANPPVTKGWKPECNCNSKPVADTVLDPFGGSGTTAGVAIKHGRKAVLCELNPEYAAFVPARIDAIAGAGWDLL